MLEGTNVQSTSICNCLIIPYLCTNKTEKQKLKHYGTDDKDN